jgi:hypothetical protein
MRASIVQQPRIRPVCRAEAEPGGDARGLPPAAIFLLGSQLDQGIFPEVLDGGLLIAPSGSVVSYHPGAESNHVRTGPFPASSGTPPPASTQGASNPARASSEAAPVERTGVRTLYENEIEAVQVAYPGTRIWRDEEGMWLLSESAVVAGLERAATFLTAVCWSESAVRAWGYWRDTIVSVRWIGPRHTNYPDGSVCAFDPLDGTWRFGDPIVALLDLYTVWAFRHLHLEILHRWPGAQSVFHPYERRIEFDPSEICGCGSGRTYGECCAPKDDARPIVPDAVSFMSHFMGGLRMPPARLAQVALNAAEPPPISTLTWK